MQIPPRVRRAAGLVWIAAVVGLVANEARKLDWQEVLGALRSYDEITLALALLIAVPGYLACASYDLIGRYCTSHDVPVPRTIAISFVGYTFSLNLGAIVGGLAFRYRLYAPSGLSNAKIGQVIGLSVLTNWSGYVVLAAGLLLAAPPALPEEWALSQTALRAVGGVLLAVALAYLGLCLWRGGERIHLFGSELLVPDLRVVGFQLALSLLSWGVIGAVITWLLPGEVSWLDVMPVVLVSAIAGVLSHVPAGLGVVEWAFAAMLGHQVPVAQLVAALLAYRAVYYIAPFLAALAVYLGLEATSSSDAAAEERV